MKLPKTDFHQRHLALKILTGVVYFIEEKENRLVLDLTNVELDEKDKNKDKWEQESCSILDEWERDSYLIQAIKYPIGMAIKVIDREGTLEIEMLANALLKVEGITLEDCSYWSSIYSGDNPLIRENPL